MKKLILVFSLAICTIIACKKDDPEPEMQGLDCSTFNDTYANGIKSIIDSKCANAGCHDGTNPRPSLKSYQEVFGARNGIKSRVTGKTMPPASAPALSSAEIDKIECWVENGAPE